MKKAILWCTLFMLLTALLSGCAFQAATGEPQESTLADSGDAFPSTQPVTQPSSEMTIPSEPETQPPETEPPMQTDLSGLYLVTVTWADHPVYSGPGYSHTCVGTVREAGVYTILEEVWDDAGNLWGKLKSGIGWIDVTGLAKDNQPVTADYADEYLLLHGYFYSCVADQSEYAVSIVFRAQENLQDVQFSSLILNDAGYALGEPLGTYAELPPDIPLVVWADFPGDLSAYCLTLTDSTGGEYHYLVSISGKDGSVVLREFRPS